MYKAQQFFQLYSIPLNQRILFASYHMEDEALVCFQGAEDTGQFTSWEAFVRSLYTRFGISTYNDPMKALTKLRQVSSVAQYKRQFEALSNRIKELPDKHKLSCFLSGLKDEIRLPVNMFKPPNLSSTFGLAKIQDGVKHRCQSLQFLVHHPPRMNSNLPSHHLRKFQLLRLKKGLCFCWA